MPKRLEIPIGTRFGRLTVIAEAEPAHYPSGDVRKLLVRCDCGSPPRSVCQCSLISGKSQSCGCLQRERLVEITKVRSKIQIKIGDRFGRWAVIGKAEPTVNGSMALCRCDCGTIRPVDEGNLKAGLTKSCGCLHRELAKQRKPPNTKHGLSKTPEYSRWHTMVQRCTDTKFPEYHNYGGRGIGVSDRWRFGEDGKSGFECYLLDMGDRPTGMTLERQNNDLGYSKENCVWRTPRQQAANRRCRSRWGTGVRRTRKGRWEGYIGIAGRYNSLGTFDTPELTSAAYQHVAALLEEDLSALINVDDDDEVGAADLSKLSTCGGSTIAAAAAGSDLPKVRLS